MSIVIRRSPIREMAALHNVMDRFMEDAWRSLGVDESNNQVLAIDVHESDDAYLLLTNLPGMNPENIEVSLHDGVLTIAGELPQPEVNEGVRVRIQERAYGNFSRSLRLPKAVNAERVEAAYENGVLALTLPKTPDAQPRQIPIKRGAALNDGQQ